MSSALRLLPNYTYQDYLRWEGRWEIINGIAFDMSPMPSPNHQRIASELNGILLNALKTNSCHCTVYQPIDLKISENDIVNPDLLIICEDFTGQYYDKPPTLVVEIISPSSRLKDTITKFDLYQGFGIVYYLLVDSEKDTILAYQLQNGKYVQMAEPYSFTMKDGCTIEPNLGSLFV